MAAEKLLIAYDGSPGANAALADMQRAGFAREVEAIVLGIADVWFYPFPADLPSSSFTDREILQRGEELRAHAISALKETTITAEHGAARVRASFPSWNVRAEAAIDWPGWGIIKKAENWGADLVVVGSGQRSTIERLEFGSVSRKVVGVCRCSVRVGRPSARPSDPSMRIIAGVDGSTDAEAAVLAAAERVWPHGSEIRLITVVDARLSHAIPALIPGLAKWSAGKEHDQGWIRKMLETTAAKLQTPDVAVSTGVLQGDPRECLIDAASRWQADAIFVGARGLSGIERFLIGSVSASVAARAPCSVEVVRPRRLSL